MGSGKLTRTLGQRANPVGGARGWRSGPHFRGGDTEKRGRRFPGANRAFPKTCGAISERLAFPLSPPVASRPPGVPASRASTDLGARTAPGPLSLKVRRRRGFPSSPGPPGLTASECCQCVQRHALQLPQAPSPRRAGPPFRPEAGGRRYRDHSTALHFRQEIVLVLFARDSSRSDLGMACLSARWGSSALTSWGTGRGATATIATNRDICTCHCNSHKSLKRPFRSPDGALIT